MHPFPPGTKVETNEEYYKRWKRKIVGQTVQVQGLPTPSRLVIVRCTLQYGNSIPEYYDHPILMMSKDLQRRNDI